MFLRTTILVEQKSSKKQKELKRIFKKLLFSKLLT